MRGDYGDPGGLGWRRSSGGPVMHWPLAWPFLLLLLALLGLLAGLFGAGLLSYAYQRLGLPPEWAFGLLLASFLGSAVNIPVARIRSRRDLAAPRVVQFFGLRYQVPPVSVPRYTVVAVNLGGAVIPTALALYLWFHDGLGAETLLSVAVVTFFVHLAAREVPGLGIVVPGLLAPAVAALMALTVGGDQAPAVAYVAGVLGSLLGADLLNLGKLADLGTPMASIGGAGTFDGVFLSGLVAVLIATL